MLRSFNLCVLCRRHHRLRHERGHLIDQISPGLFIWQSPTGRHYLITPNGDLILTGEGEPTGQSHVYPAIFSDQDDLDLGPPPGHVSAAFATTATRRSGTYGGEQTGLSP